MNEGDKIIWDSHFGYEIGYFGGVGKIYSSFECDMITGIVQGLNSYTETEIYPYSDELVLELTKKYGYEKSFSKVF